MKTSGMTDVLPLTKNQKVACNIVMGCMLVIAGVILVLAGCGVINASVKRIAAPTVLFGIGSAILFSAMIAKNSLSMWIAGIVLTCAVPSLLAAVSAAGYGVTFPIYIAAPGIGCMFAIWFSEVKFAHIKTILFFGVLAAIFSLASTGVCGWGLTSGILAAFIGVCVIAYAVGSYVKRNEEDA